VAIADRIWQLEKSRFRSSLAGCTVTIHEDLNGTVSIRYGPHVIGRYSADGNPLQSPARKPGSRGKGGPVEAVGNPKPVSHRSHRPLEIPQHRRDSHFPTLRHSDPNTTLKYYQKAIPDSVRIAAEAFELELQRRYSEVRVS
jgi:hypothetical protein